MIRRTWPTILALLVGCGAPVPEADTLFAEALAASGGEEALSRHQTMIVAGVLTFGNQGIAAPMVEYLRAPGDSWTVLDYPGLGRFESGVLGGVAWAEDPVGGPRILEGAERQQALRSADFLAAAHWATHFPERKTLGKVERDGRATWEVASTTAEGKEVHHFFDVVTHLEVGLSSTLSTPAGPQEARTRFSRWVTFDGVLMPTRVEDQTGPSSTVFDIRTVSWDAADFPPFVLPPDVQALVAANPG